MTACNCVLNFTFISLYSKPPLYSKVLSGIYKIINIRESIKYTINMMWWTLWFCKKMCAKKPSCFIISKQQLFSEGDWKIKNKKRKEIKQQVLSLNLDFINKKTTQLHITLLWLCFKGQTLFRFIPCSSSTIKLHRFVSNPNKLSYGYIFITAFKRL